MAPSGRYGLPRSFQEPLFTPRKVTQRFISHSACLPRCRFPVTAPTVALQPSFQEPATGKINRRNGNFAMVFPELALFSARCLFGRDHRMNPEVPNRYAFFFGSQAVLGRSYAGVCTCVQGVRRRIDTSIDTRVSFTERETGKR